jgi:hypothetical protein
MFVARKGSSFGYRRIDQRHVNFLVRSLRSNGALFESQQNGVRGFATERILDQAGSRKRSEVQTTTLDSRLRLPSTLPTSMDRTQQGLDPYKAVDATDSLRNAILSGSSRNAAWNLVRSTVTSPSAYRTFVLDPLLGGGARDRSGARVYFSSESKRGGDYSTSAKIPTPKSSTSSSSSLSPFGSIDPQALVKGGIDLTWSLTKMVVNFLLHFPPNTYYFLTHPKERKEKVTEIKDMVKKEFDHYWMGSKVSQSTVASACNSVPRCEQVLTSSFGVCLLLIM